MPARSLASLSLSFGLVSIPVKLYTATETESALKFNLLCKDGSRPRQQYVNEKTQEVVARTDLQKGYEFEKGHYVVFTPEELKTLEEGTSHLVDIVAFMPEQAIDPIYFDKAYFLAPDKRGGKPYHLLKEALRKSKRCALAKWASKGKQHMVQIRPTEDGLVFQQLLYADEVRSLAELHIEQASVSDAELQLALQIIEQGAVDSYNASQYEDEEKKRVLAAIEDKIAGKNIVTPQEVEMTTGGQVIDLMDALRASLVKGGETAMPVPKAKVPTAESGPALKARKEVKRAEKAAPATPARTRAKK